MTDFPLEIYWTVPLNLTPNFTKIRIFKSVFEDGGFTLIDPTNQGYTMDLIINNIVQTKFTDPDEKLLNKGSLFYHIRFYDPIGDIESSFYLTTYSLTPREQRLVNVIKQWMGPLLTRDLSDTDLLVGVKYSVQLFNQIPPVTGFEFNFFPEALEALLVFGAAAYSMLARYLGVAIKDFSYSDQGLSLTVDRGAKIQTAIEKVNTIFYDYTSMAKLDLMFGPSGVGTIHLPISLGGRIGNMSAIFDVFNAVGR